MNMCVHADLKHILIGFKQEIIMLSVYMTCRFSLSYRDLEEMMGIRGAKIDHAMLQMWVIRFVPLIDEVVRERKKLEASISFFTSSS